MNRYLLRKSLLYLLTFFVAVTIDWAIPRLMPGNPIDGLISRIQADSTASQELHGYFTESFGLDQPLWQQYLNFWRGLAARRPRAEHRVRRLVGQRADLGGAALHARPARPRDPAQLHRRATASARWLRGGRSSTTPCFPSRTCSPRRRTCGSRSSSRTSSRSSWGSSPSPAPTTSRMQPAWTWEFVRSFLDHWFLPFLTLFLVSFGGWAIGMRNLIIYELESEYANYLQALGAPSKLVRKYAYGNAVLPQMSGLALALGAVVGGALVTEIVFGYPGIGTLDHHRSAEPRLLPAPGPVPAHHHRRPDRQLHRRHRLRDRRPAHARRDPGVVGGAADSRADLVATPAIAATGEGAGES